MATLVLTEFDAIPPATSSNPFDQALQNYAERKQNSLEAGQELHKKSNQISIGLANIAIEQELEKSVPNQVEIDELSEFVRDLEIQNELTDAEGSFTG